jgi:hypothetical protein
VKPPTKKQQHQVKQEWSAGKGFGGGTNKPATNSNSDSTAGGMAARSKPPSFPPHRGSGSSGEKLDFAAFQSMTPQQQKQMLEQSGQLVKEVTYALPGLM